MLEPPFAGLLFWCARHVNHVKIRKRGTLQSVANKTFPSSAPTCWVVSSSVGASQGVNSIIAVDMLNGIAIKGTLGLGGWLFSGAHTINWLNLDFFKSSSYSFFIFGTYAEMAPKTPQPKIHSHCLRFPLICTKPIRIGATWHIKCYQRSSTSACRNCSWF